ncbi:MAG: protein involved in biosynthesis of mitomycin antibiotics/polyketide fumonisin [Candidatus Poribacteria bacterium]|nr:MAG: protein involved in biosynthesis of mitomycin antibiotics/polyketide fumonisin [Candidatus Poribacteria bacterium]
MSPRVLTDKQVRFYDEEGYLLVPGVFTEEECDEIIARAQALHARGHVPGCFRAVPPEESGGDPLKVYPRMMHPHRVDERLLHYLTHPKVADILRDLLRDGVIALQSMFYWKPPGARGQAFHQDDYYLQTKPGACIAAWIALEKMDEENGAMRVFPGSHREPILEMVPTDTSVSFTDIAVVPPPQYSELLVEMEKGDGLFFHGRLIHGSFPNRSQTRFRKSWICHYIPASSESYNPAYNPVIPMG